MDQAEKWEAQQEGGKWYVIGDRYIAEVCEWGHEGEAEANAKAIADLPALVKALRWAESFVSGFEGDEMQKIDGDLAAIREILARIDGKE